MFCFFIDVFCFIFFSCCFVSRRTHKIATISFHNQFIIGSFPFACSFSMATAILNCDNCLCWQSIPGIGAWATRKTAMNFNFFFYKFHLLAINTEGESIQHSTLFKNSMISPDIICIACTANLRIKISSTFLPVCIRRKYKLFSFCFVTHFGRFHHRRRLIWNCPRRYIILRNGHCCRS